MGELLAAVHPFGPRGLRLLLRVGGAVCGFACAHLAGASRPGRSTAAGLCAVPSSTERAGHLLRSARSPGCGAAPGSLRAGLGDIAQAGHRALGAAARSSGTRLECRLGAACRSEEHTSELQSLMRISYAVFCLKKKKKNTRP